MSNQPSLEVVDSAAGLGLSFEDQLVANGVASERQILHAKRALTV
jgi:hypothetical protein